jgi:hypothetical protein
MKITLIGDPPAADKTARKLESIGIEIDYYRNAPGTCMEIPPGTAYVLAMNARHEGARIKELARRAGARYIPIPPGWSATLGVLEREGVTDHIIGELISGHMVVGASVKQALDALGGAGRVRMARAEVEPEPSPPTPHKPRREVVSERVLVPEYRPPEPSPKDEDPKEEVMSDPKLTVVPDPAPPLSPFEQGRAELHDKVRAEREKARKLIVEFVKLRQGDVSSDEIAMLMREWSMPYNGADYMPAREAAGVPLRKPFSAHSKKRREELARDWRELMDTTPDADRPMSVRPKPRPERAGPTALRDIPTEDLIEELERRKAEARRLLDLLGDKG